MVGVFEDNGSASESELWTNVFDFTVSPDLLVQGLIAAVIIGLVGGLFPAIRAVRIPVSEALREL